MGAWGERAEFEIRVTLEVLEIEAPNYGHELSSAERAARYLALAPASYRRDVLLNRYPRLVPRYFRFALFNALRRCGDMLSKVGKVR
ncbi:MAG: hypothetical protein IT290_06330 [Deltaproteobacteria bacterium]|nr:hypothetical protein [Deltaproteobacteria bacterium]